MDNNKNFKDSLDPSKFESQFKDINNNKKEEDMTIMPTNEFERMIEEMETKIERLIMAIRELQIGLDGKNPGMEDLAAIVAAEIRKIQNDLDNMRRMRDANNKKTQEEEQQIKSGLPDDFLI